MKELARIGSRRTRLQLWRVEATLDCGSVREFRWKRRETRVQRLSICQPNSVVVRRLPTRATQVRQRLNWTTYKIDKNNDKIGVFVSIVSTKIPFKGTSKEYIGDENAEIAEAVDKAIKQCAAAKGKIAR